MSVKFDRHISTLALAASTFLAGVPASAQQLNRTGAGAATQGQCLCMDAMRSTVSAELQMTTDRLEAISDTTIPEVVACSEIGGVFMGDTCYLVADLRGPAGEPGPEGPPGRDGAISWIPLGGGGGFGGGGFGVDVTGNGIGDFPSHADAVAAGYTNGIAVDNCSGCTGSVPGSSGSSGGGSLGGFFGGIAAAIGGFFGGGGGGDGGGGSGKIICGELYRQGYLPRRIYAADMLYHKLYARPEAVRVYYAWATPYVRLMRRSRVATQLIRPLGTIWAHQMAYEMGVIATPPRFGRLTTGFLTRVHETLGAFLYGRSPMASSQSIPAHRPTRSLHLLPADFWSNIVKA